MYVILTSKPGQFHTDAGEGLQPVEAWDYLLCGRPRAHFVIAEITGAPRVTIVDDRPPHVVNRVPAKFLEHYESVAGARHALEELARGGQDFRLEPATVAA
jgi:hypothetical protein